MNKLRKFIKKWTNLQKVKGINISLQDIDECIRIYNSISRKEKPEFINEKVKEILDKCKIKTVKNKIGWRVA